jgi:hypothetical protein
MFGRYRDRVFHTKAWFQLTVVIAWVHFGQCTVPLIQMVLVTYILCFSDVSSAMMS